MDSISTGRAKLKEAIAVAGTGRVAQALGRLLAEKGVPVVAVAGRDPGRTRAAAAFISRRTEAAHINALPSLARRILIAVSDAAIAEVAAALASAGMKEGIALHTCGAVGPEPLAPLAAAGVSCGVLHPLQTIASPNQALGALPGSTFTITGDAAARKWAEQIARLLGGRAVVLRSEDRPMYHASAVMASNYIVSLIDAAAMLMSAAGFGNERESRAALRPLIEASVGNTLRHGPVEALTGPVQRGDLETVARNLKALSAAPETVRRLYCTAGLHAVQIAVRGGLDPARARQLEQLFQEYSGNG